MKKKSLIIVPLIIIISLFSCTKSEDSPVSNEITEGLRVTINGKTKIFNKVWVDQFVYEKGTTNEYTSLIVRGEIEPNSTERINFSLLKGKTGAKAVFHLGYSDSNDYQFYYDRSTNGGSFTINVISNDVNNLLKGNFNGTLQQNGGGTILDFKNGSFNIKY